MHRGRSVVLSALTLTTLVGVPTTARAGIEACGDIHIEAEAECVVESGVACEAQCTPLSVEAQCAAELELACAGECNAEISAGCTASCEASCYADCTLDPGAFDCQASCYGDCEARAMASCSTSDSECMASVEATCEAECSASCNVEAPSLDCQAECQASCEGSCYADANIGCQIDCQAGGYAECKVDIEGGCQAECDIGEGALFCDGSYIDHGNNLEECVDSLIAYLDAHVDGYAEASCADGRCEAAAGATITCSVDPEPSRGIGGLFAILGILGWGLSRRRRAPQLENLS